MAGQSHWVETIVPGAKDNREDLSQRANGFMEWLQPQFFFYIGQSLNIGNIFIRLLPFQRLQNIDNDF